jgi:hypothetical protein
MIDVIINDKNIELATTNADGFMDEMSGVPVEPEREAKKRMTTKEAAEAGPNYGTSQYETERQDESSWANK